MSPRIRNSQARRRNGAQGVLEYGLVLGLIALVVLVVLAVVGKRAVGSLCQVTSTLGQANLVANGDASCGNNANFSQFTYDPTNTHSAHASFRLGTTNVAAFSDALIPVDTTRSYTESMWAESSTHAVGAHAYLGLAYTDADGLGIRPQDVMYQGGTTTTLAADLHNGDTTVALASAANWNNVGPDYQRGIIVWNYVDGKGKSWPAKTYSRNSFLSLYAAGAVNFSSNIITLTSPWSGGFVASGTQVSDSSSGNTYAYCLASNADIPAVWTPYSWTFPAGVDTTGSAAGDHLWPGTVYVKIMVLANRDVGGNVTNIADVSLTG